MATIPAGIYPLSTQDGRDIPLDVVKPTSLIYHDLTGTTEKDINIPVGAKIALVYAKTDLLLRFENTPFGTLVQNNIYTNTILIIANLPTMIVVTPGLAKAKPYASGRIWFSFMEQWAALNQPLQTAIG